MRNPKFRVWNALKKQWMLGYDLPKLGGFSMIGEVMMFGQYSEAINSFPLADLDKMIITQFIGVNNEGKEVYEGDIDSRGNVILWNEELSLFCPHNKLRYSEEWTIVSYPIYIKDVSTIGNIFENPDLVK